MLDSLIDGPLLLSNEREGNELVGMIVRYLRTGKEPEPRTDAQRMGIEMVRPVLEKSRERIVNGSKGGSKQASKTVSKPSSESGSKPVSKQASKTVSKQASKTDSKQGSNEGGRCGSKRGSDIYSSSYNSGINSQPDRSVYPAPTDFDAARRKEREQLERFRELKREGRAVG